MIEQWFLSRCTIREKRCKKAWRQLGLRRVGFAPISQNHTNLIRRQNRLNEVKAVGTAQVCRAVAAWVQIQPVSLLG